jgi:hypothetical protein
MINTNSGSSSHYSSSSSSSSDEGTGNIFIADGVKKIIGTYYSEGSLIGRSSGYGNQLMIEGLIYTRNTVGGAVFDSNSEYNTPWGRATDKDEAELYDLHFVRKFDSSGFYSASIGKPIGKCVTKKMYFGVDSSDCINNHSSFLVKSDNRAVLNTPPGFGTKGVISR